MTEIAFSIDWLRMVAPFTDTAPNILRRLEQYFPTQKWREPERMMRPYNSGKSCDYCTVMWSEQHAEFGVMVECTGFELSIVRNRGHDVPTIIEMMIRDGFKCSRIDLAIDVLGSGGKPSEVYRAWSEKKLNTPAKKATWITASTATTGAGDTVYIGSRQSTKFLRVYDKAAEQRNKRGASCEIPNDWIRVELELKAETSVLACKAVVRAGVETTAKSYLRSIIAASGIEWIEHIFEGGNVMEVEKLGRKETDFEQWFRKIVIPAVEKAIRTGVPFARTDIERVLENTKEPTHGPR